MSAALAPSTPSTPPAAPPALSTPAPKFVVRCFIYQCHRCRGAGMITEEMFGGADFRLCPVCRGEGRYEQCETVLAPAEGVA